MIFSHRLIMMKLELNNKTIAGLDILLGSTKKNCRVSVNNSLMNEQVGFEEFETFLIGIDPNNNTNTS